MIFPCFPTGEPTPNVTWIFNSSSIQESNKYSIGSIQEGTNYGTLTVRNLTYYDRGTYTCRVANINGKSEDAVELRIQGIITVD